MESIRELSLSELKFRKGALLLNLGFLQLKAEKKEELQKELKEILRLIEVKENMRASFLSKPKEKDSA